MSDRKAIEILLKKSDKKLSRMLDIVQAQIPIAFKKRLDESLKRLQKLEELIVQARVIKQKNSIFLEKQNNGNKNQD